MHCIDAKVCYTVFIYCVACQRVCWFLLFLPCLEKCNTFVRLSRWVWVSSTNQQKTKTTTSSYDTGASMQSVYGVMWFLFICATAVRFRRRICYHHWAYICAQFAHRVQFTKLKGNRESGRVLQIDCRKFSCLCT